MDRYPHYFTEANIHFCKISNQILKIRQWIHLGNLSTSRFTNLPALGTSAIPFLPPVKPRKHPSSSKVSLPLGDLNPYPVHVKDFSASVIVSLQKSASLQNHPMNINTCPSVFIFENLLSSPPATPLLLSCSRMTNTQRCQIT